MLGAGGQTVVLTASLYRLPAERGVRRALPICEHVDGPSILSGCLHHHGHLRECLDTGLGRGCGGRWPFPSLTRLPLQTLSVSMLLRYSHHQIFVFIGESPGLVAGGKVGSASGPHGPLPTPPPKGRLTRSARPPPSARSGPAADAGDEHGHRLPCSAPVDRHPGPRG